MRPATACRAPGRARAPPRRRAARRPGSRCSARRRCRSSPAPPWRCRPPGAASAADSHCPARRRRRDSAARSSGRRRYACRQGSLDLEILHGLRAPGHRPIGAELGMEAVLPHRARRLLHHVVELRGVRHGGKALAQRMTMVLPTRRLGKASEVCFCRRKPCSGLGAIRVSICAASSATGFHRAGSPRRAPPRDCRFPRSCDPREKSGRARTASGWCSGKCSGIRCCCLVRSGTGIQHLRPGALRIRAAARRRRAGWSPPGRRPGSGCGKRGIKRRAIKSKLRLNVI